MKTGIDLIEVQRIEKLQKTKLKKIFTQKEIDYAMQYKNYSEHLAGFFCAKEAVMKALEAGIDTLSFLSIEILHENNKKPFAILKGKAKSLFLETECTNIEISISNTANYATAICIIY